MSHTSTVPPVAARYFGPAADLEWPIVAQEFHPDRGWRTNVGGDPILVEGRVVGHVVGQQHRKRITMSWARKLRASGVTAVALLCGGRLADFTVGEILSAPR